MIFPNSILISLHSICDKTIAELHKIKALEKRREALILPDASVREVQKAKLNTQKSLEELQKIRTKKVVVRL